MKANMTKLAVQTRFTASRDKYVKGIIKKTLIYIPLSHVAVIWVYSTRIAKQHNELLISTLLLLLLVLPIYLGMYPSVPVHIYPYMSKLKLLLETDDETNGLCLQWVPYMPRTTTQGVPLLVYGTSPKAYMKLVLYYAHSGM